MLAKTETVAVALAILTAVASRLFVAIETGRCKAPDAPKDCGAGDVTGTISVEPKR